MLQYRRFMMIALAVAAVCFLIGVCGCGGSERTPTGGASKSTTTGFSSNAGASGTDQQQAAAPTTTSPNYRYIYVEGTLTFLGKKDDSDVDQTITIYGSMIAAEKKGEEGNLLGNVEVTLHHHAVQHTKFNPPTIELTWDGSDKSGQIQVIGASKPVPAPQGTPARLVPFSSWNGCSGTITCTCKGDGYTVPASKKIFKEFPLTINFVINFFGGGITITVMDENYSGTLEATL
jgi:hypothetical protein